MKPRLSDDPRMIAWINEVEAGLRGARARGDALWRQGGEAKSPPPSPSATTPIRARTYVLTDYGCASACLDAVDLLKALGAAQIGQETSADSLYMEVREQPTPGGRVSVVVPMKVYRGRARGSNESRRPRPRLDRRPGRTCPASRPDRDAGSRRQVIRPRNARRSR